MQAFYEPLLTGIEATARNSRPSNAIVDVQTLVIFISLIPARSVTSHFRAAIADIQTSETRRRFQHNFTLIGHFSAALATNRQKTRQTGLPSHCHSQSPESPSADCHGVSLKLLVRGCRAGPSLSEPHETLWDIRPRPKHLGSCLPISLGDAL